MKIKVSLFFFFFSLAYHSITFFFFIFKLNFYPQIKKKVLFNNQNDFNYNLGLLILTS